MRKLIAFDFSGLTARGLLFGWLAGGVTAGGGVNQEAAGILAGSILAALQTAVMVLCCDAPSAFEVSESQWT